MQTRNVSRIWITTNSMRANKPISASSNRSENSCNNINAHTNQCKLHTRSETVSKDSVLVTNMTECMIGSAVWISVDFAVTAWMRRKFPKCF